MKIALIAGEVSGDLIGATLISALRARLPETTFTGVTGPRMRAAGCETLADIDSLSVMGFVEVLRHLPQLLVLRKRLYRELAALRPDCVIGIDAPAFNLPMERKLRRLGLRTVHLVSPTVWAWRPNRVWSIVKSTERMLCLLPFEPAFYADHPAVRAAPQFRAAYIGHPLAETLAEPESQAAARARLGVPADAPCLAVLPGSRSAEILSLMPEFAAAAARLAAQRPQLRLLVPVAKPRLRVAIEQAIAQHAPGLNWQLLDGDSRGAMRAADAVLLASGTATLECLLLDRPMVVGYKVAPFEAWVLRSFKLLNVQNVSLPNLLCGQARVPEFLQEAATAEHFAGALAPLLDDPAARAWQCEAFAAVRASLRRDAAAAAADEVARLLGR